MKRKSDNFAEIEKLQRMMGGHDFPQTSDLWIKRSDLGYFQREVHFAESDTKVRRRPQRERPVAQTGRRFWFALPRDMRLLCKHVMATNLLQIGIYTVAEASRLTGVSPQRIRRWVRGYEFKVKHGRHRSPAIWNTQLEPIDHAVALGFLDLLEIRAVDALIGAGVSWKDLRQIHQRAGRWLNTPHPFCTNRFATDGHTIFMELREKNHRVTLWDMRDVQRVFDKIIRPFLKNVDFDSARVPRRWWPRGKHRQVALDPRRSFGHPIIFREGIPTRVLARSVRANDSVEEVARWFQINPRSVHEAVDYEQALAA